MRCSLYCIKNNAFTELAVDLGISVVTVIPQRLPWKEAGLFARKDSKAEMLNNCLFSLNFVDFIDFDGLRKIVKLALILKSTVK